MNIIPQAASEKNYSEGRHGQRIEAIVVHRMEGNMDGTLAWFRNAKSGVSSHYGISKKGVVVQYVADEDTAQHAGKLVRPTAALVLEKKGINPNYFTIGIECEGFADDEPPAAQMVACAELIAQLAVQHKIPIDERHVIPHHAIRADKTCPGKMSVTELVRLARHGAAVTVRPQVGDRRWSQSLGEHVILTRYETDEKWFFLTESELRPLGKPAGTRFSSMPKP